MYRSQLRRHDRTRSRLRKRIHDYRCSLDCALAYILGVNGLIVPLYRYRLTETCSITNVATSFYEIDLAPSTFFRWGYAWPLHNVVQASRTILFDTYSRLGLNFGILAAWCVLNVALFVPCAIFMRWKSSKEQMYKCCGHDTRQEIRYLVDG